MLLQIKVGEEESRSWPAFAVITRPSTRRPPNVVVNNLQEAMSAARSRTAVAGRQRRGRSGAACAPIGLRIGSGSEVAERGEGDDTMLGWQLNCHPNISECENASGLLMLSNP